MRKVCTIKAWDQTPRAIDGASSDGIIYSQLVTLDMEGAWDAFDGLSGDIHSSVAASLMDETGVVRTALSERMRFDGASAGGLVVRGYGEGSKAGPTDIAAASAVGWGYAFGSFAERTSSDARLDVDTGGLLAGLDVALLPNARLGVLAATAMPPTTRAGAPAPRPPTTTISASTVRPILGASLSLSAGAAYAWHYIANERWISIGRAFADKLSASYDAETVQVFGEAALPFATSFATFEPFANLAYVRTELDGFGENGGAAALSFEAQDTDATCATLGLRASRSFEFGSTQATLRGMAGWRQAEGDPIAEDAALIGAGIDFHLRPMIKLGVSYNGQFGNGTEVNGFDGKLSIGF